MTLDEWKKRKTLKLELRDVRMQHVIKIKQLCVVTKIKGTYSIVNTRIQFRYVLTELLKGFRCTFRTGPLE